jgi:hypothetical protein
MLSPFSNHLRLNQWLNHEVKREKTKQVKITKQAKEGPLSPVSLFSPVSFCFLGLSSREV